MKMKKVYHSVAVAIIVVMFTGCKTNSEFRRITVEEYQSKMKAGWLGQMAGVGWGAPTEFRFNSMIIPEEMVPEWEPHMINQQYQDDIYVEMTFLRTLEEYGFDVSIRQAGIDFANSKYQLWHANLCGRDNLRQGIASPFSGHPIYNSHADDIDYQIEADYSGLIAPGMPQLVIELGDKFGRLMNYGDGVYGGQFVGAMYAEAFFESDINGIIDAGLACIPAGSQYAEAIKDVIRWHKENPDDWQLTWQLIENKYNLDYDYRRFSCSGTDPEFNIDAKINGAYIVMGLLYGGGDMDKTILISMRCGQDSDCNPSNAAGILATSLGMEKLPVKYKTGIDNTTRFSYTAYDFPALLDVCEALSRKAIIRAGGSVERGAEGVETYVIPLVTPVVGELEQCWEADVIEGDHHFSTEEMDKITIKSRKPEEYVSKWQVAGPFSKEGEEVADLLDEAFEPETNSSFSLWEELPSGEKGNIDGKINFEAYFGTEQSVAYLKTNIWSKNEDSVLFELGSDDGIRVWVNYEVVHNHNIVRGLNPGDDVVPVTLRKGWNEVVMKISQGVGGWGASLVITNPAHEVLEGYKYR